MKHTLLSVLVLVFTCVSSFAREASTHPAGPDPTRLDLSRLRALSLQDRQTIKTWDTYARQLIAAIAGKSSVDGQEPLFTVLDIAFRPGAYVDRNILRIKNVPLRKDFSEMPGLSKEEARRILEEGTVSPAFWLKPDTQAYLRKIQQSAIWKSEAINQVQQGANAFELLAGSPNRFLPAAIIPASDGDWHSLLEMTGNVLIARPTFEPIVKSWNLNRVPPAHADYDNEAVAKINDTATILLVAWNNADSVKVQEQIDALATMLPALKADVYPTAAKRNAEVIYNKLYKLTLPGAALYFIAFTCFLVAAYSASGKIRTAGVIFMVLGLLLHTVGIFVRWWLDQKSTGSWFYSIPIKNQFESVMMSAWFGILVGLVLEVWKKKSLFGAAACFVGWMSLIALFTVPYVFGKDIGGEIGRVNGILMSYWLYIHVTLATASYALIGMSFLLGVWWVVRYLSAPPEVRAMRANLLSSDAAEPEFQPESIALAFARMKPALAGPGGAIGADVAYAQPQTPTSAYEKEVDASRSMLARLDACNLVILQLAFWILLVAIVCGAIWADVSWGRPWGWDPKETFALVTWIVYLVVIHVRLVTKDKALWTALLSVIGFFIMLFNWIGVNYFLVGLHSYA